MTPTIHLNGSDPGILYSNLAELRRPVEEALKALEKCWPHRRDYPDGEQKFFADRIEVDSWQKALLLIIGGTEKTLQNIAEQTDYKYAKRE